MKNIKIQKYQLSNLERVIFKKKFITKENRLVNLLILSFFLVDVLFLIMIQNFNPRLSETKMRAIRNKYLALIYDKNIIKSVSKSPKIKEKNLSKISYSSSPEPKSNKTETRNDKSSRLQIITISISTSYDDLIDKLNIPGVESPIFKTNLDDMLANVLKKIDLNIKNRGYNPATDLYDFGNEKLKMERKVTKPTISSKRIVNEIFHRQADRPRKTVNAVLRQNERQFNYCLHRFRNSSSSDKLMLKVKFDIDHRGKVLRSGIRVIETNIENEKLLRCLIRTISSWNNFGRIAKSELTYRVVQKWIF